MDELTLKRHLFDKLGGFGDGRIKNLSKSDYFICDNRGGSDLDARGQIYLWFCTVGLRVVTGDVVHIEMGEAMPKSPAVNKWWAENTVEGKYRQNVIQISKGEEQKLGDLANLVESIIRKRYEVSSYKYVCPRTAATLRKVQNLLEEIWKD